MAMYFGSRAYEHDFSKKHQKGDVDKLTKSNHSNNQKMCKSLI